MPYSNDPESDDFHPGTWADAPGPPKVTGAPSPAPPPGASDQPLPASPGSTPEIGDGADTSAYATDPVWSRIAEHRDDEALAAALTPDDPNVALELRREWGKDFRENVFFAAKAADVAFLPDERRLLDEAGILTTPELIRAAARIGRLLAREPGNPLSIVGLDEMEAQDNRQPIDTMPADKRHAIEDEIQTIMTEHKGRPSYATDRVQRRLTWLFESLYGKGEVRR